MEPFYNQFICFPGIKSAILLINENENIVNGKSPSAKVDFGWRKSNEVNSASFNHMSENR